MTHFNSELSISSEPWFLGGREFRSRLLLGTGKFPSPSLMKQTLEACGAELVTVALRRANLTDQEDPSADILEYIDTDKYVIVPNTSGAMNADEAVRIARIGAAVGLPKWVKLEIHPDPRYLLPDPIETLKAAEVLVKEDFVVLPYINADPVLAKRLEEVGTAAVMPLGSPIGSNRGIETRGQIEIILEQCHIPVIVDAGLGAPSQAAEALEMGASAVLVNTAISIANDPPRMAQAFAYATAAGRHAYSMGLPGPRSLASATSPLTGFLDTP
ncbi:MAG: thiazole synthase [Verrucomicrobiota bacterium]